MNSYNELITLIDAVINRNGVQAITGQVLNGVLKAMVQQLGAGYSLGGVAKPTDDPGTPEAPVCYFASEVGTYTNFGGVSIVAGELALLCYDMTDGWFKETMYEGFASVGATIDGNVGTPAVDVTYNNGILSFDFRNMKGNPGQDGAAAGFGTIGATIDGNVGTPAVSVQESGPNTAKNLQFNFSNLKGETGVTSVVVSVDNTSGTPQCAVSLSGQVLTLAFTGLKGAQGDTGVSADYPITIVNNLTTNDPTSALSAAQGVQLESEISQLEAEVYVENKVPIPITESGYYIKTSNGVGNHIGGKTESGAYSYMRHPVSPGDIIIVNGTGGASPRLWCFIDEDEIILEAANASVTESNQQHIAPANSAEIIINTNNTSVPSYHLTRELVSLRVVELSADVIEGWILSESFTASSVTRGSDGNVSSANVVWPDAKTGTITITRNSDGNATSVAATHDGKSYTLTITRDSDGNVTATSIS